MKSIPSIHGDITNIEGAASSARQLKDDAPAAEGDDGEEDYYGDEDFEDDGVGNGDGSPQRPRTRPSPEKKPLPSSLAESSKSPEDLTSSMKESNADADVAPVQAVRSNSLEPLSSSHSIEPAPTSKEPSPSKPLPLSLKTPEATEKESSAVDEYDNEDYEAEFEDDAEPISPLKPSSPPKVTKVDLSDKENLSVGDGNADVSNKSRLGESAERAKTPKSTTKPKTPNKKIALDEDENYEDAYADEGFDDFDVSFKETD